MGYSLDSVGRGFGNVGSDIRNGLNPLDRLLPSAYSSGQFIGTAAGQMIFRSISSQWLNSTQGRYKEMIAEGKNGQRYPVKVFARKDGKPLTQLEYQNALTTFINANGVSAENVFAKVGAHNGNAKKTALVQNPSLGLGTSIAKIIMGDTSKPVLSPDPKNLYGWHDVQIRPGETIQVRFKGLAQGKPVYLAKGTTSTTMTLTGFSSFSEAASYAGEKARGGALTPRAHDNLKLSAGELSANQRAFSRNSDMANKGTTGKGIHGESIPKADKGNPLLQAQSLSPGKAKNPKVWASQALEQVKKLPTPEPKPVTLNAMDTQLGLVFGAPQNLLSKGVNGVSSLIGEGIGNLFGMPKDSAKQKLFAQNRGSVALHELNTAKIPTDDQGRFMLPNNADGGKFLANLVAATGLAGDPTGSGFHNVQKVGLALDKGLAKKYGLNVDFIPVVSGLTDS